MLLFLKASNPNLIFSCFDPCRSIEIAFPCWAGRFLDLSCSMFSLSITHHRPPIAPTTHRSHHPRTHPSRGSKNDTSKANRKPPSFTKSISAIICVFFQDWFQHTAPWEERQQKSLNALFFFPFWPVQCCFFLSFCLICSHCADFVSFRLVEAFLSSFVTNLCPFVAFIDQTTLRSQLKKSD